MSDPESLRTSAKNNKITQAEFDQLYVNSLDSKTYRPVVEGERHFYLAKLLSDHSYSLDLTDLSLRNLDFTYADFTGVRLDGADLSGSRCNYATFTGVSCCNIIADENTKFYGVKLTDLQLSQLRSEPGMDQVRAVQKGEVDLVVGVDALFALSSSDVAE